MKTLSVIACVVLLATPPLTAEDTVFRCEEGFDLSFGPEVVSGDAWSDRFGFGVDLGACASDHDMTVGFPVSWIVHAEGRYLAARSSSDVPDGTRIQFGVGGSVSISEPEKKAPRDLPPHLLPTFKGGGFNVGFVDLLGTLAYEASADRAEQHVSAGGSVHYAVNASGVGRLMPSLVVAAEWVEPLKSDVRDARQIADASDAHGRLTMRAYWNTKLDFLSLANFRFRADLALFRTRGQEQVLMDEGWSEGESVSADLVYTIPKSVRLGLLSARSVHLSYRKGQLPTEAAGQSAVSGGIDLSF